MKIFLISFLLNFFPKNVDCYSHLAVEELFSEYFEWKMATHPQAATYAGYHLHSDQLDDLSLDALLDVGIKCHQFQERALKILEWPQLHPRLDLQHPRLDLQHQRLDLQHLTLDLHQPRPLFTIQSQK